MSSSQIESKEDTPAAANSNCDNKKNTSETKRKPSAMTRRLSFSMARPWSSYAENYSSRLSGLRRNSSEQLIKRQGSLQSSPTSSSSDLSNSFDSGQLRNLKATTPDSETRMFKISAMHARPFHQRRWSSPVAFSVTKLAPSSQQAPKQLKEENGSGEILQDCNKDKNKDKICETDEIMLSQEQDKTPVSTAHVESKAVKGRTTEETLSDSPNFNASKATSSNPHVAGNSKNKEEKEVGKTEQTKMNGSQLRCTNDKTNSDAPPESSEVKEEDPTQNRNIYTEIKKNTKWSKSKSFRRRHHTIHADSRRFINPTLFTITEQSSGSFGSVIRSGQDERFDRVMNGKLITRRSKSLGDLNTLSDDMKINGVSVQQLCAKPIYVSVASSKNNNEEKASRGTTVTYKGEEKSENTSKRQTPCSVQVNIQTFNKIQITPVVEGKQKPQAGKVQPYYSTQQHAVFTQPKAKWASITISQV